MREVLKMSKVINKEVETAIKKLNSIEKELGNYIYEKEEVFKLIKVALVGKRNLFMLGKTGQAKTFVISEYMKRITGSTFFETLMSKQKDEEQLFARLDIASYVNGTVNVITKDKLLEADVAMLDEFFKAGEPILDSLLKYLNFEDVNLEGITIKNKGIATFTASNEIPDFLKEEDQILRPLYDRLHLKMITDYIKDKDNFKAAARAKVSRSAQKISNTMDIYELRLLNEKAWEVVIPDEIWDLVWDLSSKIHEKTDYEVSDRKKIESGIVLQSYALINGRDKVIREDLDILKYYLWEKPETISSIAEIVNDFIENPLKDTILGYKSTASELVEEAIKQVASLGEGIQDKKNKMKALKKAKNELIQVHTLIEQTEVAVTKDEDRVLIRETFDYLDEIYEKLTKHFGYTYRPLEEEKEMAE
jgi:MoxR-like ATPase